MILNIFLGGQHVFTLFFLRFALGSVCVHSLALNGWSYTAAYKSKNVLLFHTEKHYIQIINESVILIVIPSLLFVSISNMLVASSSKGEYNLEENKNIKFLGFSIS